MKELNPEGKLNYMIEDANVQEKIRQTVFTKTLASTITAIQLARADL